MRVGPGDGGAQNAAPTASLQHEARALRKRVSMRTIATAAQRTQRRDGSKKLRSCLEFGAV
eukprot:7204877-Lingulodinium_polyedra.AAC.1